LRALEGDSGDDRSVIRLPLAERWRGRVDRLQYVPVRIDRADPAAWLAVPPAPGTGGSTRGLGDADGYAVIPPGERDLEPGDLVDVRLA
jgi:molybdopterin molybdotransferase